MIQKNWQELIKPNKLKSSKPAPTTAKRNDVSPSRSSAASA
jgi:hypothetical protein